MRKSIAAYDGFVGLYGHPHGIRNQAADRIKLAGIHAGMETEVGVLPDNHHHFFERGIAGAFAETVDGAFYLPGAGNDAGNGVGWRVARSI